MAPPVDSANTLPSQKIYEELNGRSSCSVVPGGSGKCCSAVVNGRASDLEDALGIYQYIGKDLAPKVTANWYHARELGNGTSPPGISLSQDERCKFLYYWTGSKIKSDKFSGGTTLKDAMSGIYRQLNMFSCMHPCTLLYSDNSSTYILKYGKDLFDYKYNNEKLKGGGDDSSTYCTNPKYTALRDKAQRAYSWLCSACRDTGSQYCTEFKQNYWDNNNNKGKWKDWPPEDLKPLECPTETKEVIQHQTV